MLFYKKFLSYKQHIVLQLKLITKQLLKQTLQYNKLLHIFVVNILFLYFKLVYYTSTWTFIWPQALDKDKINQLNGSLFAMWHNRLVFGMHILKEINNVHALVSSHHDGMIISDILKKMNFSVIFGSTNRNSIQALKEIISKICSGNNVVITPDGPRGPIYKVNSSIARLAKKFHKPLIPISCSSDRHYTIPRSWDKMIIPKPFSKITVRFGNPLHLNNSIQKNNILLEQALAALSIDQNRQ